jgi:hypothetical protein
VANKLLTPPLVPDTPMTLDALKAQAYDCLVQIERWQAKLRAANEAIANYKPEKDTNA